MEALERQNIDEFLVRFNSFYDAILRSICIQLRSRGQPSKVEFEISVQDNEREEHDAWVNIHFCVEGSSEIVIHESNQGSYQVLSDGLHINVFDGCYFIEFGDCIDGPESLTEVRNSKFYLAGKSVLWGVVPYKE